MSAHDVAAELRRRIPGVGVLKLHKLLYYCQGHHLAVHESPLFSESVMAYDHGPLVATLWHAEKYGPEVPASPITDESSLNTIGYVVSRYGKLSGKDLENLTHNEAPWMLADRNRSPGTSVRIEIDWIKGFFRTVGPGGQDDDEQEQADPRVVSAWLRETAGHGPDPHARPDSREAILARLAHS